MRWRTRALLLILLAGIGVVLWLIAGGDPSPAAEFERPPTLAEANALGARLEQASEDPSARNEDLIQYIAALFDAYVGLRVPPTLDAAARPAVAKEHAQFRWDAGDLLVECLEVVDVREGENRRVAVNIAAARTLARLAPHLEERNRQQLSKAIRRTVERKLTKVRAYEVSPLLIEEVFAALARLGTPDALQWMLKTYAHTKVYEAPYLQAAHKALPLFERVPGALRHRVVETIVRVYAGVEAMAVRSASERDIELREFWARAGPGVVHVAQHYAGRPRNEEGLLLASMAEFQAWLRFHKDLHAAPWTDPKPAK